MKVRKKFLPFPVIAVSLASVIGVSGEVLAAEAAGAATGEVAELEPVVVTGTRTISRTVAESLSPIDQLSGKTLESSGSAELATVLGKELPSINFPRPSITDLSDAVRPAQLRGLSPDHTLVLVNGKRRHTTSIINTSGVQGRGSAPVDLNTIPIAAIERIEVLRDGAAAQYGSDAIAGVINIILKKGAQGGSVQAQYGKYDEGDGGQYKVSTTFGVPVSDRGWLRFTLEQRDQDYTNRALPDTDPLAGPAFGQVNQRFGDPDSKQQTLFVNGDIQLTDWLDFYVFGSYGKRDTKAPGVFRKALASNNNPALYPAGFLPIEDSETHDQSLVAGLRGTTDGGWRWDTSVNYGANTFSLDVNNTLNLSLGANSPRSFYDGELENSQVLFNVDLAKEFSVAALAGPLTVGLGAEARHENYEISPGNPDSYFGSGAQAFSGFRPADSGSHSRNSQAVYLNLEADLTKKLSASAALRREHYSDFGNATSAKLAGRYEFTPGFALRGTASTGFRAPSLAQQYYSTTTTQFISGVPFEVKTFPVNDPVARQLGAEPLKAETSLNYSLGFLLQPTKAFTTTVDLYQIEIDDRIVLSENLTGAGVQAFLAGHGITNANGGRYFTNAVNTRTRGIDIVSSYRVDLQDFGGKLDLSAGYNHNITKVTDVAPNPAILAANGLALQRIGRVEEGRITKSSPKDKLTLAADYTRGDWTLHGLLTRYGKFTAVNANPSGALDQEIDASWVLDLAASYKIKQWTLTGGVDNVTDTYPDKFKTPAQRPLPALNYSQSSPYGFNGRFFYVKAGFTW